MAHFYAHGKLLLSGEYVILDGALGLGLPTRSGQHLYVEQAASTDRFHWQSFNVDGQIWHDLHFDPNALNYLQGNDDGAGKRLQQVLQSANQLSKGKFSPGPCNVRTSLEFDRFWGLGTSSTLLYNIAQWTRVDPYDLAKLTFGGSGYDLACAGANGPILFQRRDDRGHYIQVPFQPTFAPQLHLVYLGQKQNSREGIKHYRGQTKDKPVRRINQITLALLQAPDLNSFRELLVEHEQLISEVIGLPCIGDHLFPDAIGTVKSLGAWGGDFILYASPEAPKAVISYFKAKGYNTILPFTEVVL